MVMPDRPGTQQPRHRGQLRLQRLQTPAPRSRLSLAAARQLLEYAKSTSVWRRVAVVVLFPVPSVLASFLAPLIPLQDPTKGFYNNPAYQLLLFTTCMLTFSGTMPQVRAAAAIPHELYTNTDLILVGLVSSVPLMGLATLVATYWRFPVPFFWVLIATPWMLCVMFGNAVVLRRHWHVVGRPLLAYAPSMAVQVAQIVIYPAYSALFEVAGDKSQLALIVLFPAVKIVLKKIIFLLTRSSNRELSSEISVSAVEICSSMYQSMIMQTTPSVLATALVIGIDVLQGLYAVSRFVLDGAALQGADAMALVAHAVKQAPGIVDAGDSNLIRSQPRRSRFWSFSLARNPSRLVPVMTTRTVMPVASTDGVRDKRSLLRALELLHTAETILLVEYLEVAVPLVNALYLAFATQFESAIYNPRLRGFYQNPGELGAAISSVVVYTVLQAITLVVMAIALQFRLKLSALTLMAFVLEKHAWSLQGKLIPWMSVFFVFPILHFGVDFTFRFDFSMQPLS